MKTLQELGLPKGFRLTMKGKSNIIDTACEEKFGKRVEAVGDMELQIINCITEFVYSKERRDTHYQGITAFDSKRDNYEPWYPLDLMSALASIDIPVSSKLMKAAGLMRKLPKNLREMFKNAPLSSATFSLGSYGWGKQKQTQLTVNFQWLPKGFAEDFWAPEPDNHRARLSNYEIIEQLPIEYLRKIYELIFEAIKLENEHNSLKSALSAVLGGFTSAIELCNTHPEFIQWIIKSTGEEEVARCSDIPIADAMQDVRKILGK